MKNRFYTLLIVPEKSSPINKFTISLPFLRWVVVSAALLVLTLGVIIFDYWSIVYRINENVTLKAENKELKQRIQFAEENLTSLKKTVHQVKDFSLRLRHMMNLKENLPISELSHPVSDTEPKSLNQSSYYQNLQQNMTTTLQTLNEGLEGTIKEARTIGHDLETVLKEFQKQKLSLASLPTIKPAEGYYTSGFGIRVSPFGNRLKMHEGIDIANRVGTPVIATADGQVVFAGNKNGYGLSIIINHGQGIETFYAHLKAFRVKKGDVIKRGRLIGFLGNTGRSTGPHLHYEVRLNGLPVNPAYYIFEEFIQS